LIPMLQLFDAPEPLTPIGVRGSTTIGPQALWFLNNPQVRSWAAHFAQQLKPAYAESPASAVRQVYLSALRREPDEAERQLALEFLEQQAERYRTAGQGNAVDLALADLCQSIMSLNEFIYVE